MSLLFQLEGMRRGPRAEALAPAWVLIRDGRVVHAGPRRPEALPPGCATVRGGWAVEPLADAHVHLHLAGAVPRQERLAVTTLGRGAALGRILALLEDYRRRGCAAVRDGGDPHGLTLAAAEVANRSPERYAAVLPAGEPVRRAGHYGGFLAAGVETVGQGLRLLQANRAAGATHAKILATGVNSLEEPGAVGPAQFSRTELDALVRGARDLGLAVMVHANGPLPEVLPTAPDTVEHGFWLERVDLELMAERGIGWVPTLGAWAELCRNPDLTPPQQAVVAATDRRHRQEVAEGAALGVSLLAGSDAGTPGVPHGDGLWRELVRLSGAGLSGAQALASATWSSRSLCERGLERHLGGLEEGGRAGLLWVSRDPVLDLGALERPWGVHLGGAWTPAAGAPETLHEIRVP